MRDLAVLVISLAAVTACGGRSREPEAPADPAPLPRPSRGPGAGSAAAPPPVTCPAGQIAIESCVVGGMPREDGTANVSCGTSCSPTPPSQSADQSCQQVAPDRYRCTGYAP